MILPILIYPDTHLRAVCNKVTKFDDHLRQLAADMIDTMLDADGIGLAACQIGALERVIVLKPYKSERPSVMVNPRIVMKSQTTSISEEGCLSVPKTFLDVERYDWVSVRYFNLKGESKTRRLIGLASRVAQHELEHLNGVMFMDKVFA